MDVRGKKHLLNKQSKGRIVFISYIIEAVTAFRRFRFSSLYFTQPEK